MTGQGFVEADGIQQLWTKEKSNTKSSSKQSPTPQKLLLTFKKKKLFIHFKNTKIPKKNFISQRAARYPSEHHSEPLRSPSPESRPRLQHSSQGCSKIHCTASRNPRSDPTPRRGALKHGGNTEASNQRRVFSQFQGLRGVPLPASQELGGSNSW